MNSNHTTCAFDTFKQDPIMASFSEITSDIFLLIKAARALCLITEAIHTSVAVSLAHENDDDHNENCLNKCSHHETCCNAQKHTKRHSHPASACNMQ